MTMIGRQSSALAAPAGPKITIPIVMMHADLDLACLAANWQGGAGEPSGAAIPEPAILVLLLAGAGGILLNRRRSA